MYTFAIDYDYKYALFKLRLLYFCTFIDEIMIHVCVYIIM